MKTITKIILLLTLVLVNISVFAQGQLCLLSTHKYYQALTISNSGSALSNFQIKLTVNTSTPVAGGKMLSSGNDIRFTDASCTNIEYFIESGMNTASTVIWIKVPSVPAGSSTIYMYYGYSSASAASNASNVFDLFDDFNGSTLSALWTSEIGPSSSISVSGGAATFSATGGYSVATSTSTFSSPVWTEMKVNSVSGYWGMLGQYGSGSGQINSAYYGPSSSMYMGNNAGSGTGRGCNFYTSTAAGTLTGVWSLYWNATNDGKLIWPGGTYTFSTTPTKPATIYAGLGLLNTSSGSLVADWMRVRKYAASDPTVSFGPEYPNYNIDIVSISNASGVATTFCAGDNFAMANNIIGQYPSSLFLSLELSDASGSFASPTAFWAISGGAGTYTFQPYTWGYPSFAWPTGLPYGTGYKLRLKNTTTPVFYGAPSAALTFGSKPTAVTFSINNSAQCDETDAFKFTASNSMATGNSTSYSWTYGDGNTGSGSPVTHGYNGQGTYNVKLIAYNSSLSMCKDSATKPVVVYPQPNAVVNIYDDCVQNDHYFYSWNSTVSPGYIAIYKWAFGDGGTSTSSNPSYHYSTFGNYTVTLIITSDKGCKDTATVSHNAWPTPTAVWTSDLACDKHYVQFHGNATVNGFGSSKISSYSWDFGDAGQSQDRNPQHLYPNTGSYSVFQTVYSQYGCRDTLRKTVVVNPSPTASFTAANTCMNAKVPLTNTSSISAGSLNYYWTFGNGTNNNTALPTLNYPQSGTYNIKLIATANTGCVDSTNKDVTIFTLPTAQFTSNKVCLGTPTDFTNFSTGASTYKWTFQAAATSTTANPSYTYATDGSRSVKLVTTTANGCKDSISNQVDVWAMPAVSYTAASPTNCLRGNKFTFTNTSSINSGTMTYNWDFGDNTVSALTSPVKSYFAAGSYITKLTATSDKGCKATSSGLTLTVNPHPVAKFNAGNACVNANITFTNNSSISSGTITTHSWTFGDAGNSALASPQHAYATAGPFVTTLIETSNQGCKDTQQQIVIAWPNPVADFTGQDECQGTPSPFENASTVAGGGLMSYFWTFDDGKNSTDLNPLHLYATAGLYNVKLITTTEHNCAASTTKSVNVWTLPKAAFSISSVCEGQSTSFTDGSTPGAQITTWDWTFGDGGTASSQNPGHTYAHSGNYNVGLTAGTSHGCLDHATNLAIVKALARAQIQASTTHTSVLDPVIDFEDVGDNVRYHEWKFGTNNRSSNLRSDTCSYTMPGTFVITLKSTSADGCSDQDTVTVRVDNGYTIYFPNAFTPNNDNLNEGFGAVGVFNGINVYSLNILDNKGRVIFSTTDIHKKWNGKLDNTGENLDNSNYAWFAEYTEFTGKKHKVNGIVSIRR